MLEIAPSVRNGMLRDLLRSPSHDDLPTFIAALGTEVDDPVRTADHVEVVLDHKDRIPLVDEPLHHIHQLVDVVEAQASCGLIDQIEGLAGGPFGEFGRQLDPLGFTTGEGWCRLAELDVTQAHVHQGAKSIRRLGDC